MSKLEAVNTCLIALGLQPVNTLDDPVGDVATSILFIDRVTKEILADGLPCNIEKVTIEPNETDNRLYVPTFAIVVVTGDRRYVHRGSFIWNTEDSTYEFDDSLDVVIYRDLDFEELPYEVQNFIAIKSARLLIKTLDGDTERYQLTADDWFQAVGNLQRYKLAGWSPNVLFDNETNLNVVNRRRIYRDWR